MTTGLSAEDNILYPGPLGIKFWTASHSQPMCLEGSERSDVFSTFKHKAEDSISLFKIV